MHIPDGFIDLPTSAAFAGGAAASVGQALRKARATFDDRTAPLAGLTAVFVFAVQMLNFPVAAGTSGHLLGGALAAVLVGPWAATLAITVVLLVQAFLFADGGLTAIGLNVVNMAVIGVWSAWGCFLLVRRFLPARRPSIAVAALVGAFVSVPVTALGFVAEYAIGGTATYAIGTVLTAMVSTHVLIGIGEAVITGLTVSAIMATRGDLVYGWRGREPELELRAR